MAQVAPANSGKTLTILHINIQSLRKKYHPFSAFLSDKRFDIVCIGEHWLAYDEVEFVRFDGYKVLSCFCRTNHIHGGVMILARESLDCYSNDWVVGRSVEFLCELTSITIPDLNLVVITCYRNGDGGIGLFGDVLDGVLAWVTGKPSVTVVLNGDF